MVKKVVIYNNTYFSLSETFIWEQAHLLRNTFDIFLVGNKIENESHFDVSGLKFHLIRTSDPWYLRLINLLRRWLRLYTPLNFVEEKGLKTFLRSIEPGLVHAHFGYNALKLLPLLKALNIPMIVTFHGIDASNRIYGQLKYLQRLPDLLNYASRIIVVSSHMIDTLGITEAQRKKVSIIPYSVDHDYFRSELPASKQGDVLNIIHSGRLVAKKGVPDLIRVFADLCIKAKHIRLQILGAGPEYDDCAQLVRELQLGDLVTFHGSQPRDRVRALMETADIFVLNSRVAENGDMEGTPVSLLEAMSMQRAVVSTYHAGIPDVISDMHNGLLVRERCNDELYKALHTLVYDCHLRTRLATNARATIVDRYNKNMLTTRLTNEYKAVFAMLNAI